MTDKEKYMGNGQNRHVLFHVRLMVQKRVSSTSIGTISISGWTAFQMV